MNEQAYMIAWAAYACGYLLVLLILWRWTSGWWRLPKYAVRLLWVSAMAAVLPHPDQSELLVPAVIMALLGWVMDGPEVALPALRLMGLAAAVGCFIAVIAVAIAARLAPKTQSKPHTEQDADAVAEASTSEPQQDDPAVMDDAAIVEPPAKA